LRIMSIYNWESGESRLGSGGGSLARAGPTVPTAPAPLIATADANLQWTASEAVREVLDLVVRELRSPLEYATINAKAAPDDVD